MDYTWKLKPFYIISQVEILDDNTVDDDNVDRTKCVQQSISMLKHFH